MSSRVRSLAGRQRDVPPRGLSTAATQTTTDMTRKITTEVPVIARPPDCHRSDPDDRARQSVKRAAKSTFLYRSINDVLMCLHVRQQGTRDLVEWAAASNP